MFYVVDREEMSYQTPEQVPNIFQQVSAYQPSQYPSMPLRLFQEQILRFVRTTKVPIEAEIACSVQTTLHAALSRQPTMPSSQWVLKVVPPEQGDRSVKLTAYYLVPRSGLHRGSSLTPLYKFTVITRTISKRVCSLIGQLGRYSESLWTGQVGLVGPTAITNSGNALLSLLPFKCFSQQSYHQPHINKLLMCG